jgi:hypothetical protein
MKDETSVVAGNFSLHISFLNGTSTNYLAARQCMSVDIF